MADLNDLSRPVTTDTEPNVLDTLRAHIVRAAQWSWASTANKVAGLMSATTAAVGGGRSMRLYRRNDANSADEEIVSLPGVSIGGTAASAPASDVYSWAKAASKPSYSKAEVGLSNVDNTADSAKSVSYAATAGSAGYATSAGSATTAGYATSAGSAPASDVYAWAKATTKPGYGKAEVGLSNVDNTADSAKNVSSAATLTTGRTIGITGDITYTSPAFNGSGNVSATATLASSGVTAGTYTNATFTVNSKGLVVDASNGTSGAPTTDQVLSATAGATAGAVGTYAFLRHTTSADYAFGATLAGSSLVPAGLASSNNSIYNTISTYAQGSIGAVYQNSAQSGTWRCMGVGGNGLMGCPQLATTTTSLWLRIS